MVLKTPPRRRRHPKAKPVQQQRKDTSVQNINSIVRDKLVHSIEEADTTRKYLRSMADSLQVEMHEAVKRLHNDEYGSTHDQLREALRIGAVAEDIKSLLHANEAARRTVERLRDRLKAVDEARIANKIAGA